MPTDSLQPLNKDKAKWFPKNISFSLLASSWVELVCSKQYGALDIFGRTDKFYTVVLPLCQGRYHTELTCTLLYVYNIIYIMHK